MIQYPVRKRTIGAYNRLRSFAAADRRAPSLTHAPGEMRDQCSIFCIRPLRKERRAFFFRKVFPKASISPVPEYLLIWPGSFYFQTLFVPIIQLLSEVP